MAHNLYEILPRLRGAVDCQMCGVIGIPLEQSKMCQIGPAARGCQQTVAPKRPCCVTDVPRRRTHALLVQIGPKRMHLFKAGIQRIPRRRFP